MTSWRSLQRLRKAFAISLGLVFAHRSRLGANRDRTVRAVHRWKRVAVTLNLAGGLVAAALAMVVAPVQAQIVYPMSPERIREAISLGTSARALGPYRIQEKARWSWPPLIAVYTTPFLRVALAANAAKNRYQQFTEADVTSAMIAPEIQIYAPSQSVQGTAIANVETIVVLPYNSKDASQAVHPAQLKEASQEYKNLLGFTGEGRGMLAIFPLDAWQESNEVHVVFDMAIPSSHGPSARGGCIDCKSRIYLEKIR